MIRIDYINTGIDNIKDFFGRQKTINDIKHRLKSYQSISLFGERKIGKTSLLKYLFQVVIRDVPLPDAELTVILYQTFAGKQNISQADFLKRLYDELSIQMEYEKEVETINRYEFEDFIRSCYQNGKRFIFFFDEFDATLEIQWFDQFFFSFLRSLSEMYQVQYIIASRKSIKELLAEKNVVSPFYNLFSGNVFKLEVFDKEDAIAFCEKLSKDALAGNTIAHDQILGLAGTHPFLIRLAFFHAVNLCIESKQKRVDSDKLRSTFEKESFHAYFYDVWLHMDMAERNLIIQFGKENKIDNLKLSEKNIKDDFFGKGLIYLNKNDGYCFINEYFKEFVLEDALKKDQGQDQENDEDKEKPKIIKTATDFDPKTFNDLLQRVESNFENPDIKANEKGKSFEDMVAYIFENHKDYFSTRQKVRTRTSEHDIHLWFKPGDDPVLQMFGNEIILECKNWRQPVGKPEINDLAGDMVGRKCKTGILVSRKGITGKAFKDANGQRLVWFFSGFNLIILVLTFEDIKSIKHGKNLIDILKEKYEELIER
jgi:energy-coupling factor transporter ATP-binding protein EcfA2